MKTNTAKVVNTVTQLKVSKTNEPNTNKANTNKLSNTSNISKVNGTKSNTTKSNSSKTSSTKVNQIEEVEVMEDEYVERREVTNESELKEEYVRTIIDLFSWTNHPLRKKVRVENINSDDPRSWLIDMKEVDSNTYYCVKIGLIGMSDLEKYIYERAYPKILAANFKLYLVSPGITDKARAFIDQMC